MLTVGLKLWRNTHYIEYVLRSVYEIADKIAIAWGPVPCMTIFKDDDTLQKIKQFPDPDKKIVIDVQHGWKSITEMVNTTYDHATDLYMKLDGDEIISPELADEIKTNLPHCQKSGKCIVLSNIHFFRSFRQHVWKSAIDPWRLRIFKVSKKHRWRHPDFVPGIWNTPTDAGLRLKNPIFHYPYVMPVTEIILKLVYHLMNWKHLKFPVAVHEAKDRITKLKNNTYAWKIKDYDRVHPEIMKDHPFRNISFPWEFNDKLLQMEVK